ncbi:MAG: O-antigen ligase family protein [Methylophilaceae bacterium]
MVTIKETESLTVPPWMARYGWLFVAAFILLQPLGNAFELPIAIMACLGLWLALTQPRAVMALPAFKPLLLMFACIWLPMLASLTDAFFLSRAAQTTLSFLRFPLAALFATMVLSSSIARNRLLLLIGLGLSAAAFIVVILTATGHSSEGRMNLGFPVGHILAVLSPIYFYWLWRMPQQHRWVWFIAPLYIMAILFSGARVAWIMLAVGILLWAIQIFWVEKVKWRWKTTMVITSLLTLSIGTVFYNPGSSERMVLTAGLLSGDYAKTNAATSLRLPIWKVAVEVAKDHWIKGIGPRGFRYIYPAYVPKDDYWLIPRLRDGVWEFYKTGPTHPHQMLLEIIVETGVIGLLGFLVVLVYWIKLYLRTARDNMRQTLPWMAAAFIAIMPINAHMAFYASFWSCITWWLIAVSLAFWQAEGKEI